MTKTILILAAFAALTPATQPPIRPPAQAVQGVRPDGQTISQIETEFESKLKSLDMNDPVQLLGAASGVYVNGCGMVFTTPLSLATTPDRSPFEPVISKAKAQIVHDQKVKHLPLVTKTLKDAVAAAANKLKALSPGDRIVFAARVYYLDWEDRSGLPSQIVASADRASALAGNIQVDVQ